MAHVCLIRPPSVVAKLSLTRNYAPPLSLAYLAGSATAAGHTTTVIDGLGSALDRVAPTSHAGLYLHGLSVDEIAARVPASADLVGVSCLFSTEWPVTRAILRAVARRLPSARLLLGGEHATALPELCLGEVPELGACALGEGEETLVDVLDRIAAERDPWDAPGLVRRDGAGTVRTAPRARIRHVDAIPRPRWDLTPLSEYLDRRLGFGVDRGRSIAMLATRGCPYRCTFCSSPQMWTTRYVARDPARVVDEIESYVRDHAISNVDFYDLTAVVNRRWILAFCDELVRRRVSISWQLPSGTRSEAIDAEVAHRMYAAGCRNVSYAPESGSPRTLTRIKKRVDLDRMLRSMQESVSAGLNVKANIVIGFPDDDHEDIAETMRFIVRMARAGIHDVSVWTFAPYPGSELYGRLVGEGKIGPPDDDYFAGLLSYADLAADTSYTDQVSARALSRYRVAGMALFYGASYAGHPLRPVRTIANVLRGEHESRVEASIAALVDRFRPARSTPRAHA